MNPRQLLRKALVEGAVPFWKILRLPLARLARLGRLVELRAAGVTLGTGVQVYGKVRVLGTGKVTLGKEGNLYGEVVLETQGEGKITAGDHFVLNQGTILCAFSEITMGDHVLVGEYASIRDNDHDFRAGLDKDGSFVSSPIRIGDRVWIGRGCCVTRGVTIGEGSVIGANSVVTRDIPPRSLAVGAPAKVIRTLP